MTNSAYLFTHLPVEPSLPKIRSVTPTELWFGSVVAENCGCTDSTLRLEMSAAAEDAVATIVRSFWLFSIMYGVQRAAGWLNGVWRCVEPFDEFFQALETCESCESPPTAEFFC